MHVQPNSHQLIACAECGLVVHIPIIKPSQSAHCPQCQYSLTKIYARPYQGVIAISIASLVALILSLSFPFMSFSVQGITQQITLLHAAKMLAEFHNILLGGLLLVTVLVLPALYISLILFMHLWAARSPRLPLSKRLAMLARILCKILFHIKPWLMVDVFLIGVLVSLIKISALASVSMGGAFWAFCAYAVLVVKCITMVDKSWLWGHFIPIKKIPNVHAGESHLSHNHIGCHTCHQINPINSGKVRLCLRCRSPLNLYDPKINLQKSWALLLASAILYLPANLYPMMYTVSLGYSQGSTILEGVILLWQLKSYPVAAVIFFASIFIPMAKMLTLSWLYYNAQRTSYLIPEESLSRLKIYRITELIGRWSMIDIFVVAILVALVQLQNFMAIFPGPAALSFAAVVILTMLSAMTFDPRILWQAPPKDKQSHLSNQLTGIVDHE
ncbi:paraquat-inducible protein A [Vibrio sagamiensis]|nr:paraquat-inducible protein A [Vibrio sagamiensis]PNQ59263.1 paraquat-inducible protein A [Vibrio agarivorans]